MSTPASRVAVTFRAWCPNFHGPTAKPTASEEDGEFRICQRSTSHVKRASPTIALAQYVSKNPLNGLADGRVSASFSRHARLRRVQLLRDDRANLVVDPPRYCDG